MANATHAFGVSLAYVGTPNVEIGQITNIGGLEMTADTIEVTNHSGTDKFKEFIQGLRDGGELNVEYDWDATDAGQLAIIDHYNLDTNGGVDAMIVTFPDESTFEFNAIVTALSPVGSAPVDDVMKGSATFKVTGAPTFTEAGGS